FPCGPSPRVPFPRVPTVPFPCVRSPRVPTVPFPRALAAHARTFPSLPHVPLLLLLLPECAIFLLQPLPQPSDPPLRPFFAPPRLRLFLDEVALLQPACAPKVPLPAWRDVSLQL